MTQKRIATCMVPLFSASFWPKFPYSLFLCKNIVHFSATTVANHMLVVYNCLVSVMDDSYLHSSQESWISSNFK